MDKVMENNHGEVDQDQQYKVAPLIPEKGDDFPEAAFSFGKFAPVKEGMVGDVKENQEERIR